MDVTLRFWLGVGLALAALLGTAAPVAARDVPRDFYGTVLDGDVLGAPTAVLAQQWPRMASSGAETVRVVFSWSLAQPVARGPIDFSATDALVAGAAGHGLDVLPVVMYTPGWARADPTAVASPPVRNADYTAYLTALVGRYGPDGSFWSGLPGIARPGALGQSASDHSGRCRPAAHERLFPARAASRPAAGGARVLVHVGVVVQRHQPVQLRRALPAGRLRQRGGAAAGGRLRAQRAPARGLSQDGSRSVRVRDRTPGTRAAARSRRR
jgi:hypothetical protein